MRHDKHELYIRGMDAFTIVPNYLLWLLFGRSRAHVGISWSGIGSAGAPLHLFAALGG